MANTFVPLPFTYGAKHWKGLLGTDYYHCQLDLSVLRLICPWKTAKLTSINTMENVPLNYNLIQLVEGTFYLFDEAEHCQGIIYPTFEYTEFDKQCKIIYNLKAHASSEFAL